MMKKTESLKGISLELDAELEFHQRYPDAQNPFLVKRTSWSWFSAEIVRIQPTELDFRVKGDAAYLALHDYVRFDGETRINGGSRSTLY
jgi:AraC family transcriptional regulator